MDQDIFPEHVRGLPLETQVAVLYERVRGLSNDLHEVSDRLDKIKQTLWGFVLSILAGAIIFLLSIALGWIGPRGAAHTSTLHALHWVVMWL